ncbi:MAG: Uma2 family endonuclease [Leptolyngbyaceae cyanobacterium RM2_2_4]|nr:Uma2 family endonuclease [Leptolyngbyaceae cyanobacterium SM1_4_3]NJN90907.1 Uma2 family endonuclease [Leptolyngbyaceae cyanobacterium SL_5_14]NJO48891.1 Uma2 family endonuclease [Leptolyngbyaceae cyanobacterium RM2_2_4]NJO67026.1 Uma2 family endonuclease [Leptolyngbyaceae cyanobacterium RM1_405_57]
MDALTLNLRPVLELTDEQFEKLAVANRDLRLERTAKGELIVMPPTGGSTGKRNANLTFQVQAWSNQHPLGVVFDSSTAFRLQNGATRSPDVSWIRQSRWDSLPPEQQERFPPICPDFVVELRSRTDGLKDLQNKMQEYLENGAQLGWLIDPQTKQVEVYRVGRSPEVLQSPMQLSGENMLPGFTLDLKPIFD